MNFISSGWRDIKILSVWWGMVGPGSCYTLYFSDSCWFCSKLCFPSSWDSQPPLFDLFRTLLRPVWHRLNCVCVCARARLLETVRYYRYRFSISPFPELPKIYGEASITNYKKDKSYVIVWTIRAIISLKKPFPFVMYPPILYCV